MMNENKELQVMAEYWPIAEKLAKSSLVPASFKNPVDAWYAILYGANLGLSAIYSLSNVSVINGKPGLSADAMLAIVKRSSEYGGITVHATNESCNVKLTRNYANGVVDVTETAFTIDDAKAAGLLDSKGQMYKKYPKRMLRARAVAFACRDAFGDLLAGTYSPEEMENETDRVIAPQKPDYEVIETPQPPTVREAVEPEPEAEPTASKVEIAQAVKAAEKALAGVALMGSDATAFRAAIKEAAQAGDIEALETLTEHIATQGTKKEERKKPEPVEIVVEPDVHPVDEELEIKQQIIAVGRELEKIYVSSTHMANSVKKQLGLEFEKTDWAAEVMACSVKIDTLKAALKYWTDAVDRSKDKPNITVTKAQAVKAVKAVPEGEIRTMLEQMLLEPKPDYETIVAIYNEKQWEN
jgi:hypothetical protein